MGGLTTPLKTSVSGAGAGSAKRTTPSASTSPAKWPVSHSILIMPSLWGGIVPAKRAAMPPAERSTRWMVRGAAPSFRSVKA